MSIKGDEILKPDINKEERLEDIASATSHDVSHTANEKRLLRRIDFFVMPWICVLYALSLIDRTNIGAANVSGLAVDLKLKGNMYSVALLSFFPTYMLSMIPSNIIVRHVGTKKYLSVLILSWGLIAMCFGFVKNFNQLVALRVLLGIFEGGYNPACIYLISSWNKRYETQTRLSVWYMTGSLISGFGGIISYALSTMEGDGGLRGWRWIFIVPGALTAVLSIPIFLFISEFPEEAKWLSPEDKQAVKERLDQDRGEGERDRMNFKEIRAALLDWKVWVLSSLLFFITTGAYALSFFTPSILKGFGFNVALSQILVTPPYIFATFMSIGTGGVADRMHKRSPFVFGYCLLTIVGFLMIGWGNNTGCKLTGIFFAVAGVNCVTPTILTFLSNNIVGTSKRAIAIPLQTVFGGLGGIAGSLVFRSQDYPHYRPGMYAAFSCMGCVILITGALVLYFKRENDKADRGEKVLEGLPGYRYTL